MGGQRPGGATAPLSHGPLDGPFVPGAPGSWPGLLVACTAPVQLPHAVHPIQGWHYTCLPLRKLQTESQ